MPQYPINNVYSAATSGLLADYRFDTISQTLIDYSGNGLNGILGSSSGADSQDPLFSATYSRGIVFAASSSSYIQLPTKNWIQSNSFYIEICILLISYASNARLIDFGNASGSDNFYLGFSQTTGQLIFGASNGTTSVGNFTSPLNNPLYYWNFIQINSNSGNAFFYSNGAYAGVAIIPSLNNVQRSINYIGRSNSGSNYLDGIMASLKIYSQGLTNLQRASNYLAARDILKTQGIIIP